MNRKPWFGEHWVTCSQSAINVQMCHRSHFVLPFSATWWLLHVLIKTSLCLKFDHNVLHTNSPSDVCSMSTSRIATYKKIETNLLHTHCFEHTVCTLYNIWVYAYCTEKLYTRKCIQVGSSILSNIVLYVYVLYILVYTRYTNLNCN